MKIRAEEILSILFNSEHLKAFSIFKEALQREHADIIVRMIDETDLPYEYNVLIEPEEHPIYSHNEYRGFPRISPSRIWPWAYFRKQNYQK